jgi:nucleoside-diphosphate-sugar epimerase
LKVLITGANGYLGKVICQKLLLDNEIITLSRINSNLNFDLSNPIPNINNNIDLVIHAAGKAHLNPISNDEILNFYKTNVIGTKNLLNALLPQPPKQFVFISSVSVYGLITGQNVKESTNLYALDPYGKSKFEAEEVVKKWCYEHNVICTILRLPLVVGENPPGNLGAMICGIKKGYYFNIAGGIAKKSMVLATDVAKFILTASEKGGIYNLTDGYHPTFNELSKNIAFNMGKSYVPNLPKFIAYLLAKFGDHLGNNFPLNSDKYLKITSTLTFDDNKARMAFGWNPSPVLDYFKLQQDVK